MKDGVPERKANRLATYNYSQSGVYFITICSKNKRCTFGTIVGGGVPDAPRTRLSPTGKIVARQLGNMIAFYPHVRIEKYVVMPNHIHLLIAIQEGPSGASRTPPPTSARASQVIPMFISTLKRLTNKTAGHALWQRGYYDHIIRSPDDYNTIWHYIDTNPAKWAQDTLYVTDFPDPVRRPGCYTNKEVTQMSRYFTKTLAALEPYTPGEQLKLPDLVKLAANANPDPYLCAPETGYRNVTDPNKGVILEIRRERTIELCLEGHRYYDIIRWKEGKMFEQPFLGMYFPGLTQGSGDNRYDVFDMNDGIAGDKEKVDICIYTGKKPSVKNIRKFYKLGDEFVLTDGDKGNIICHDIEKEPRQWREDRDYLYPIPTQERLLSNGTLSQNPNWNDGLDF